MSIIIGSLLPVTFPIEINNVGSSNINYKVETLLEENEKNSAFKIFDVKNPSGTLSPNEKQYLYCQFRPLETKLYTFDLKIQVFDLFRPIDEILVKIEGSGFHKKKIKTQVTLF